MTRPKAKNTPEKAWWVYILRCADDTLYCGSTPDLERRIEAHNDGRGAKYTRGRAPVSVAYSKRMGDRSCALKEESKIKALTRKGKLELISGQGS